MSQLQFVDVGCGTYVAQTTAGQYTIKYYPGFAEADPMWGCNFNGRHIDCCFDGLDEAQAKCQEHYEKGQTVAWKKYELPVLGETYILENEHGVFTCWCDDDGTWRAELDNDSQWDSTGCLEGVKKACEQYRPFRFELKPLKWLVDHGLDGSEDYADTPLGRYVVEAESGFENDFYYQCRFKNEDIGWEADLSDAKRLCEEHWDKHIHDLLRKVVKR